MTVIQINLSKTFDTEGVDNELLKLLTDVFDERMTGEQKVKTLKETYGLPVTQDFKEAMDMCTYADYIEKKGIEQGIEKGKLQGYNAAKDEFMDSLLRKDEEIARLKKLLEEK